MSENIEYSTDNFTKVFKKFNVVGTKVLLKKLVPTLDKKYGDILIPQSINKNNSFGIAKICELGTDKSFEELGLSVGDFVLYDYFSVYNDNKEYVITNNENIILKLTEEEATDLINNSVING